MLLNKEIKAGDISVQTNDSYEIKQLLETIDY